MEILIPILAVTVIGLICAVGLAVASSVMAVKEDTRFTEIRACLPGANCGACGYTGCDGYAKALLEPGTKTNLCVPGADAVAAQIAALLGVEAEDVVEKIGVKRSRESVRDADLILYVADSSTRLDENDQEIMELLKEKKAVVLLNKTDLEAVTTEESLVEKLREAGVDKTEIIPISALEN